MIVFSIPRQAQLDALQSLTGALLAIFLWVHLILVSSILLGHDAMLWVTKTMEGAFLTADGSGYPVIVSFIAAGIFGLFVIHTLLACRKMPTNYRQWQSLRQQMQTVRHADTRYWMVQAVTGIVIMFLLPPHLFVMLMQPETIGPIKSSVRIYEQGFWLLYLPLLIAAELHAAFGLYRVILKWDFFSVSLRDLRPTMGRVKNVLSAVFIVVGTAALVTYFMIGMNLR